ncbi:MAG: tRNA lysidine(34) synthetase TilS, partial [Blastocatellia bacterium]
RLDSVAAAAPSLLVRPMLCLSREEIERYCHNRGLEFRIDASNFSHDYTRNRIRHTILSDLRSINPKVEQALAGASELLAEDDRALDLIADSALNGALPSETERAIFASTKACPYRVGPFVMQESAIMRRMIIRAANLCSEAAQLGMTNVLAVERLIREGRTGKHIVVPGGISVWRDGGLVVFGYDGDAPYEIELNENAGEVEAGGFVISIERGLQFHTLRQLMDDAIEQNRSASNNWMSAILDDGKVPASLLVRTRRKGEVALVYGQRSVKKLKILMIDHRIPVSRRPAWPVVASVDGRYLWSPELPPSIEFCACNETRSLAVLRARISQPETGEPAT